MILKEVSGKIKTKHEQEVIINGEDYFRDSRGDIDLIERDTNITLKKSISPLQ